MAISLRLNVSEGGAPPYSQAPCSPARGLKRSGASSAERSAKKGRGTSGADEDLLVALAMSRSLLEKEKARAKRLRGELSCGKGGRAEKRRRLKAPCLLPPLLLQDPGTAHQEMEAQVALLVLPAARELPSTPPLPASHLLGTQQSRGLPPCLPGSLWELSSLAGGSLPGCFSAAGSSLPVQSFKPRPVAQPRVGLQARELGPSHACGPSDQNGETAWSQQDMAGTLQDLVELAGEGLTLTQWDFDVRWQDGSGQEQVAPRDPSQKTTVCLQEEKSESLGSPHQMLSSLAAAFRTMVNNPHLSDVQFQVDSGEILYAHLFVLYARCPQLLEVVDLTGFTVAEDGAAATRRVLLSQVPGEAVAAFLKYLYASDSCIPRHLRPDVGALAARFGVWDLAALCGSPFDLGAPGGAEDGDRGEEEEEEEDRAETFKELLESVWLEEDEEVFPQSAHQEGSSRETVGEQELEEIYEFAATQRLAASGAGREEEEKEGGGRSEGKQGHGGSWAGCRLTGSREGLGDPAAAAALRTPADPDPPSLSCPPSASREGGLQRAPCQLRWLGRALGAPGETSVQHSRLESPTSLEEGRGSSPEPVGVGSGASAAESLQPVRKMFPREGSHEPLGPAPLPLKESVLLPSPQRGTALPTDHLPCARGPCLSASPAGPTRGDSSPPRFSSSSSSSSQTALEAPCGGQGEPLFSARPLLGRIDEVPIVVLDSDEEWESGASVASPGIPGQLLGVSGCPGLSPLPQRGFGDGDGRGSGLLHRLASSTSQELLGLSSGDEDGDREGVKTLVPDTPLLSRAAQGSVPHAWASLLPGPGLERWTGDSWVRASPERLSLRDPLLRLPLPAPLPRSSIGSSPPSLQDEVVVVGDSEEEEDEESPVEEDMPVGQRAVGIAEGGDAGSQRGSHPPAVGAEGGSPLAVGGRVSADCGGRRWTGGAGDDSDGSDALPLTQRSPSPPQTTPDSAFQPQGRPLPVTPLTPMPSYAAMATPELKKELKRFGVRALPKRQMVLKLREIFQFTHRGRGAESEEGAAPAQAPAPAPPAPLRHPAATPWESSSGPCQVGARGPERPGFPGGSEQLVRRAALPAAGLVRASGGGSGGSPAFPPASQESTGSPAAGSETSVLSHSSSSAAEEEALLLASQAAGCKEGKLEAFRRYIHSTPGLRRQILLYQPIELAVLQAELKQNGIRIALGQLLDLLDAHGITFTTAEARREKHQRSQQTGNRRGRRQRWC